MVSYYKERDANDLDRNLVAVSMGLFNLDLAGGMNWARQYHYKKQAEFLDLREQVPSFGPKVDEVLKEYVGLLGNFVRANHCYHLESKRYFGDVPLGLKVQENMCVPLLPEVAAGGSTVVHMIRKEGGD